MPRLVMVPAEISPGVASVGNWMSVSSVEASTSPEAQPTDGWGSSAMLWALVSGLAGIEDLAQAVETGMPLGHDHVDALGEAFSSGLINIILDLLMIAGTLAAMFLLDARLTLVLLLLAPPILAVLEIIRRRLRVLFLEVREALAAVNAFLAERVDGVEVVQLFGNEKHSEELFDARMERFRRATTRSNLYDSFM